MENGADAAQKKGLEGSSRGLDEQGGQAAGGEWKLWRKITAIRFNFQQ